MNSNLKLLTFLKQWNQYNQPGIKEHMRSTQGKQRFLGAYQYGLCICQVKGLFQRC